MEIALIAPILLVAAFLGACMYLLVGRGVGATLFPGSLAYRLGPWSRLAVLSGLGYALVAATALGIRAPTFTSSSTLTLIAIALALSSAMFLVFLGHVVRAQAMEPRRPWVVAAEMVFFLTMLWLVSAVD